MVHHLLTHMLWEMILKFSPVVASWVIRTHSLECSDQVNRGELSTGLLLPTETYRLLGLKGYRGINNPEDHRKKVLGTKNRCHGMDFLSRSATNG